jgi:glyoxylase-like metal-dependent hydrolase (beta-lactamase superfamily II)
MLLHREPVSRRFGVTSIAKIALVIVSLQFSSAISADPFLLTFSEPAPGVWVGIRENSPRLPVVGNSVFVVGDEGVVVFDGGSVPRGSEQVVAKIRKVTSLPVTHVVISHWHGDHNLGISSILEAFPSAQVVGHEFTRAAMLGSNMDYARKPDRVEGYLPPMQAVVETGKDEEGNPVSDTTREWYRTFLAESDIVDTEYRRARIVPPTVTFSDQMVIHSGERRIELLFLGEANTAGDIVLWLPADRLVATGDIVVVPTPYGFNMPPGKWVQTLRNINSLGYSILVPGHGAIQQNNAYVDLLIETAESIMEQRTALLTEGLSPEVAQEQLDFSAFKPRYTHGDALLSERFDEWFAQPFGAAAFKALSGEPMVLVEPSKVEASGE